MRITTQLMALAGIVGIIYGVYQLSGPAAWIAGGAALFVYAEVSLLPRAPDTSEDDG